LGTVFATGSAILYTASNIFLRCSITSDAMWVQCVKEVPIVILIGPWMFVRYFRGQHVFPPAKVVAIILFAAVLTQFVGNWYFQFSLGIIGISLAVPILLGAIIVGGAILSRVFLGEAIAPRSAVAMAVLLVAIGLLGWAAQQSAAQVGDSTAVIGETPPLRMVEGVGAVVLAGCAFAALTVTLRYGVSGASPISTTTVLVGLVGVVGLGSMSYARLGWEKLAETTPTEFGVMLAAGVCNALAFLCMTKAFQLINVVRVNSISSSQCALAAIAGVFLFGEEWSLAMIAGVVLTVFGLCVMQSGEDAEPQNHSEPQVSNMASGDGECPTERTPVSGTS
jgi:drug/metabolite transporter (DMT)-like permease